MKNKPEAAELTSTGVFYLFVRPGEFFDGRYKLDRWKYLGPVLWFWGASATIDRIQKWLFRAEHGSGPSGWDQLGQFVGDSWGGFWVFVGVSAALSALPLWWLWGWWYLARLRWSGVRDPDPARARTIMAYAEFVQAGPKLLVTLIYTFTFASYAKAYRADEWYSLALLLFPFWSSIVSYRGVLVAFDGIPGRMRTWFLTLPCVVYGVSLLVIAIAASVLA